MLGIGLTEMLLIAVVALLVVGPEQLPGMMRTAGKTYGQVRRMADEMRRAFVSEADRLDAEDRYETLKERRRKAEADRQAALKSVGPGAVAQEEAVVVPLRKEPGYQDVMMGAAAQSSPPARAPGPALVPEPADQDGLDEGPPPGFTASEWAEVPDKLKDLVKSSRKAT